jgi:pimeloyl-ACP methyl ester carboxylesterase
MSERTGTRLRRALRAVALACWAGQATACALPRPTAVPLASEAFPAHADGRACCLVVLLPGHGDTPRDFVEHGFVKALRDARIPVDVIAVAAHSGYYFKGIVAERLHADVLAPARAAGYKQIWLVGVSMGGFGALWTAQLHPEDVSGLVLLAPFTGRPRVVNPIAATGIRRWQPRPERGTWDYELWRWLHRLAEPAAAVLPPLPPIFLAHGQDDASAGSLMLAELLPPEQVLVIPGDHDWDTWIPLWTQLVARVPWTGAADPRPPAP